MSRSGYSDDCDIDWNWICWRGAVASAIRGKRGQQFLREMLAAMDALPEKELIANDLEADGAVCAIGTVGKARGIDMSGLDPEDREKIAGIFGVARALVAETVFVNDEGGKHDETPAARFLRVRHWIESWLIEWEAAQHV